MLERRAVPGPRKVQGCPREGCMGTTQAGTGNRDTHGHGHRARTAPGPEEQLVPLSVIPPLWLAWAGTFPCHKHPGRASASASAHAAPPRLRRCCCRLLQHLPQTSQQLQPRVIFPDQTHPSVLHSLPANAEPLLLRTVPGEEHGTGTALFSTTSLVILHPLPVTENCQELAGCPSLLPLH